MHVARDGRVVSMGGVECRRDRQHEHGGDRRQQANMGPPVSHEVKHLGFNSGCQVIPHRGESLPAARVIVTQVRGSSRER